MKSIRCPWCNWTRPVDRECRTPACIDRLAKNEAEAIPMETGEGSERKRECGGGRRVIRSTRGLA